jgi:hypothetical protein
MEEGKTNNTLLGQKIARGIALAIFVPFSFQIAGFH